MRTARVDASKVKLNADDDEGEDGRLKTAKPASAVISSPSIRRRGLAMRYDLPEA